MILGRSIWPLSSGLFLVCKQAFKNIAMLAVSDEL
jgi:hypothetical protein